MSKPTTAAYVRETRGLSALLILRVTTRATAQLKADSTGKTAARSKAPAPGLTTMRTPRRPTATALHRRHPTTSPRIGIDSAVTIMGDANEIAVASAIGRNDNPVIKKMDEPSTPRARRVCRLGLLERRARACPVSTAVPSIRRVNTQNRSHATSTAGRVAVMSLEAASEQEKKASAASMKTMPRSGRSRGMVGSFIEMIGYLRFHPNAVTVKR
jgi:hypothetical protein